MSPILDAEAIKLSSEFQWTELTWLRCAFNVVSKPFFLRTQIFICEIREILKKSGGCLHILTNPSEPPLAKNWLLDVKEIDCSGFLIGYSSSKTSSTLAFDECDKTTYPSLPQLAITWSAPQLTHFLSLTVMIPNRVVDIRFMWIKT